MFGDMVKYATRTIAVSAVIAAIVLLFTVVPIPAPDYTLFSQMIGKGYALMSHWVPAFPAIYSFIITVLGLWVAIKTLKFSISGIAFVLKVMS